MSLPKETACTIENIYALPDGQRAELIDGQMYMMAPPTYKHQRLVVQLSRIIGNYIAEQKSTCEVLPAPFAVNLHADKTYVEPDISVICDKNKLSDRGCEGAPDFIIEIVSPSSRRMDYNTKKCSLFGSRRSRILDCGSGQRMHYRVSLRGGCRSYDMSL